VLVDAVEWYMSYAEQKRVHGEPLKQELVLTPAKWPCAVCRAPVKVLLLPHERVRPVYCRACGRGLDVTGHRLMDASTDYTAALPALESLASDGDE